MQTNYATLKAKLDQVDTKRTFSKWLSIATTQWKNSLQNPDSLLFKMQSQYSQLQEDVPVMKHIPTLFTTTRNTLEYIMELYVKEAVTPVFNRFGLTPPTYKYLLPSSYNRNTFNKTFLATLSDEYPVVTDETASLLFTQLKDHLVSSNMDKLDTDYYGYCAEQLQSAEFVLNKNTITIKRYLSYRYYNTKNKLKALMTVMTEREEASLYGRVSPVIDQLWNIKLEDLDSKGRILASDSPIIHKILVQKSGGIRLFFNDEATAKSQYEFYTNYLKEKQQNAA